jgi:integrase
VFDAAADRAGVHAVTPHGLRHTPASLAIQSDASVKAVQTMLGHETAAVTLRVYSHLFAGDLDTLADGMSALAEAAAGGC